MAITGQTRRWRRDSGLRKRRRAPRIGVCLFCVKSKARRPSPSRSWRRCRRGRGNTRRRFTMVPSTPGLSGEQRNSNTAVSSGNGRPSRSSLPAAALLPPANSQVTRNSLCEATMTGAIMRFHQKARRRFCAPPVGVMFSGGSMGSASRFLYRRKAKRLHASLIERSATRGASVAAHQHPAIMPALIEKAKPCQSKLVCAQ